MRFRLQCKRAMTVFLALLTVILAFCFVHPVSADQTVTPTAVPTVTNQPNAPNRGNQSTQSIAQASLATGNSQQTNQSTSATVSDGAKANKSATTAAKSAEDNLSAAKQDAQSTADQPRSTSASNDSQTMNIRDRKTTAAPQTLAAEKATQATAGQEIQPTSVDATITDASGKEIPAGQPSQVNQYSPLNIHFSFDLTGKNVQPGDYFNFTIGNSGNHLSVQNTSIQLYDQNSKHIGYVDLTGTDGQINGRVTFTTTGSDANGEFNVQLKVDGNNTSSGTTVPVTITLPNDHKITGEFKYVPGSDAPEEQFSKYSYNSTLGPDKSNPKATDPDYYTPDDITKGNLTYAIRLIHHDGDAEYTKATITDQLQTPGFTYDSESFLLYKTHWTYAESDDGSYHWSSGSLHNIPSSGYTLTISADDRSFTMDFDTPTLGDGDGYIIFYRLLYNGEPVNKITNVNDKPADGTIIHNTAELNRPGGKTITYPQTMKISGSDGKAQVKFFTVTVTKTDQANKPLAGATFQLIRNADKSVVQTKTTGADGKLTFDRLLRDNYTLHELVAPSGYDLAKDVQISSADFAKTHDYAVTIKDDVVPTTSVKVTKQWDDNNDQDGIRPKSVTVHLLVNGVKNRQFRVLNEDNSWTATFDNLPVNQDGHAITYTVAEEAVANYTPTVTGNAKDGFTITNTHTPATTSVTVTKSWNDNNDQDGIRPDKVIVDLLANGSKKGQTKELSKSNNWTATFDNLPVSQDGHAITYTVAEEAVANYTSKVTGDATQGFTITNTEREQPKPEVTSVTVIKKWDDNNNQDGLRKAVQVQLYQQNSDQTTPTSYGDTVELNDQNSWKTTWNNLPKYDKQGKLIKYTVKEVAVPAGYTSSLAGNAQDGFKITNTHTPATTSIKVTKNWDDSNDQDGLRPKSVTVHLMNGTQPVQTKVLNAENHWSVTFDQLAVNEDGKPITYTVKEDEVANYTSAVTGDVKNGFTITNTHTPATTSVKVTKSWNDNNDQDGLRPKSVTVHLFANDSKTDQYRVLNKGNNWTATFDNLPVSQNGESIKYTVAEDGVANYTSATTGNAKDGFIITNTHTPATTSIKVTKSWNDNNDQDGLRPKSVTVHLFANDSKTDQYRVLNKGNNWTATFDNLPVSQNGESIKYTVAEEAVANYTPTVTGNANNGFTITNTHTPATASIKVTKSWDDSNDQDGLRPKSVTVYLMNGDQVVQTKVLNAENHWSATFDQLAVNEDGKPITYTVKEDGVANYTSTVTGNANDGFTITNTHTPVTISKSVTKQWADNDNRDGIRPTSIKVNLLANDKVVKTVTLNATNNWTATVNNLAQKAEGQDIKYAWQEADVPAGYQATVDGDTITNTHTPATISKNVTKQWVDNDNQDGIRPTSIKVNLLANGKVVKTLTLSATNKWTATVNGLAQKAEGQDIKYAWQEVNVPDGYQATVDGDTITNTHTPATIAKTVTKQWVDNDNQDGIRPTEITVNLLANGKVVNTLTLSATDNWTATVSGLAQKAKGQDIDYTWQEADVPAGYQAKVNGDLITNTHTPATISKSVTKQWVDNDNQDGIRPTTITVNLLANGKVVQTLTLSATNNWTATVNSLAQKANGQDIKYAWQEANVPAGYQSTVNGDLITNTHTPATIAKTITKQWVDNDNQDGIRPTEITVNLLANGKVIKTLTLNTANNWTATVTGLAQKANGQDIKYTWQEANVPAGYQSTVNGDLIINTHTPATIAKTVTKQWIDNDNQDGIRPTEITVNLLANDKVVRTLTLNAANNWTATVSGLAQKADGQDINYTWQESTVPAGYQATVDDDTITNTHAPVTTSLTVNKVWNDVNNQDGIRPTSIKVNLLANDEVVKTIELTAGGNWTGGWTNLPVYQAGKKINYTVEEANVPDGYEATVDGDTITNIHTPATTSLTVNKIWNDANNQDGLRPTSIKVNLLANGQIIKNVELTANGNWTAVWTDLPVYQAGKKIDYAVEEANVPDGYEATVDGDTITNTHTPATISKSVTKQWVDNDNQDGIRPTEITVNLLANGKVVKTMTLSAANNWTATVTGLAQKADGQDIKYTWQEDNVPAGYQATVDGDTITNTHIPATISKSVTKQWVDNDNQDGIRPTTITVNLLANGKVVKTLTLSATNNWTATVNDLAQKAKGQDIDYTWQEANVPAGYQTKVDGDMITNTHTPATIAKTVTKQWVDNDNQDGIRPTTITVNLLANGKVVKMVTLSVANNWRATVSGLAQKADGQDINYIWQEANVPAGYKATVDGDTITNTHTPATITKSITKQWVDNDNQDGIRPTEITVNLLANGKVVRTLTLSAANNWTATVNDLAQKAKGQDINYTWQESTVPAGYQATVDGDLITNAHTPATTSLTVNKVWNDANNQDGLRPTSIKVNLLANGQVVKVIELTADGNWTAGWTNLPVYQAGKKIDYAVEEVNVPDGYEATVNGDTITNTHTPVTITKSVTKQWVDNDNQDGIRPTEITVNLLANGKVVKTLTLSATNNWTATVTGLAQKANGQDIDYTWQEANVPAGYQSTVDGDMITNTHTPATIAKTVTKQWVDNDNQDGIRPAEITVNLLANGKVVKTLTLNATNNWTATVSDLAQKADGQDINYTWQEANVPADYQATVDGDTITNTHTPATIAKTVTKRWVDNDNQDGIRPNEITVNLLANGKVVKTMTLSAANNWTATVIGLAQKANGQDIKYTWQEDNVPAGYQATVDGDLITNTHTPATITKTVTKQWVDNDNQDGIRPSKITVNLLANGKLVQTLTLSAANNWTTTVKDLAQKANGQDIDYTWQEANVPAGYTGAVDGDTITNTHTPATTAVTVTKVWNDADNKDGIRPTSVTINLLANGKVVKTVDLSAVNNWTASWNNLPVYQAGKRVTYTVEEANVPAGYQSMVSQNGHDFTVTNTHQPATPNTPNVPGTPVTPGQPGAPVVPDQPNVPGQPQTPVQPTQPGMPKQPAGQGQPRLPQTGNHDGLALMALGLAMLSLTIGVVKLHD